MARTKIRRGDSVYIKYGMNKGLWGTVIHIDEDGFYHVAILDDKSCCPIFTRSDLRLPRR